MTIVPPRGTSGTARTASRNRRRRPQPGEPRHAANAPAFEDATASRRRNTRHPGDDVRDESTADGLGAQLYEVMSDSERETAVAETLLFVRPSFDEPLPEPEPERLFPRVTLTEAELASADLPGTGPVAETILFTRPDGWEDAAERYFAAHPEAAHPEVAHTTEAAHAPEAAGTEPETPVRREVTPLTETFLFGPPPPPARHAQEPRSPVDGAAETLLFAGLARALATQPDEPPATDWERRPWADRDRNPAQPLPEEDERASRRVRRRNPGAEEFETGAAGLDRPGRVVNRKRSRATDFDHDVPPPESAWQPVYPAAEESRDLSSSWIPEQSPGPAESWLPEQAAGANENWQSPEPAESWLPEQAAGQAEAWGTGENWGPEDSWGPEESWETAENWETAGTEPEPAAHDDPFGAESSPAGLAKVAAADAAWRAFAVGEREPGTEIRTNRRAKSRWQTFTGEAAENAPKRRMFLWPVLLRCLLYLGPLSVAVAGAGALGRVAWPVPAATLLLGWAAAQGLTSVGVTVARRAGPEAAVRLVATGFAGITALWIAIVWIAPLGLLGHDRLLAAFVGAGGLATLATVTAALVSRAESAVIGWYVPCWLLAGTALAAAGGIGWARHVPVETLLPAAIVAVLIRALRPGVLVGRECRIPRITGVELRRGLAYLGIGAAQAICVALLWQAGPAVTPTPAALPLLLAVPMLEALIAWHTARIDAGLDSARTVAEFDRHVRNVTVITLAGLLPPLAAGGALAMAAYQLPYQLTHLGTTRAAVLALAAGTLLGGVFAITFLLAARSRTGIAAALAAAPPLATLALPLLPQPLAGPLPLAVAVLAATHVAGLLIVALTAADLRRTS